MKLVKNVPNKGFTLIELLVVIAIIGILASTVLASLSSARASARDSARIQEARQLMTSLELYRNNNGGYPCSGPTSGTVLNCLAGTANGSVDLVIKNNTGTYTALASVFRGATGVNFSPSRDSVYSSAIIYRVSNLALGNPSNTQDRTGYIILVQLERRNGGYCGIRQGRGHDSYPINTTYPNCF
jgi:prepilin-type N-terminal cleavage/methylation domain-containing protein